MLTIEKLHLERLSGGKKFRKNLFHWPCLWLKHQHSPSFHIVGSFKAFALCFPVRATSALWTSSGQHRNNSSQQKCYQFADRAGWPLARVWHVQQHGMENASPATTALSPCCSLQIWSGQQANHSQEHTMARRHARRQLHATAITPLEDKSPRLSNYFLTLQFPSIPTKKLFFRL